MSVSVQRINKISHDDDTDDDCYIVSCISLVNNKS